MSEIGILPTDTLYGLVTSALDPEAVEKVYELKQRDTSKPFIILISDQSELATFDIVVDEKLQLELNKYWPGPVSIALPLPDNIEVRNKWEYLHRGNNSLAFRLPNNEQLITWLAMHGPTVAPSANPESQPPATTITEAKKYFGDNLDFYIDAGRPLTGAPSTLLYWDGEKMEKIR